MEFWQANKFFEELFNVPPDLITILVVGVCIALFILSFFSEKLRGISPSLMLSAGIIGTFWGTFIALADFQTGTAKDAIDHNAMVISIPMVLSGMKSAFVTSLIGLLSAFVAKTVFHFLPRYEIITDFDKEIAGLLKEIKDGLIGENDKSLSSQLGSLRAECRDSVSELKKSISGDSESSVSSQLMKLRNENKEGLEEIKDGLIGEGDKSLSSQLGSLRAEYRDSVSELKKSISGDSESSVSSQLIKLRNENKEDFKNLDGSLDGLSDAISGDSETSVSSQLIELRKENKEDFKNLDGRLDGLSDAIRNSLVDSINSLIKELKDVITNQLVKQLEETNKLLSNQLNEMIKRIEEVLINQFGETFKQFNEATQAIKRWQEDHRQHVEELTEAFKVAARGIEKIRTDCESIPATMEALKNLMGELDERLKAFAEMKQQAEESFPVIKERLDKIGNDLKESADGFGGLPEIISNVGEKMTESAEQVIESSEKIINEIRDAEEEYRKEIHTTTTDIAKGWGKNMVGIAEEVAKKIKQPD